LDAFAGTCSSAVGALKRGVDLILVEKKGEFVEKFVQQGWDVVRTKLFGTNELDFGDFAPLEQKAKGSVQETFNALAKGATELEALEDNSEDDEIAKEQKLLARKRKLQEIESAKQEAERKKRKHKRDATKETTTDTPAKSAADKGKDKVGTEQSTTKVPPGKPTKTAAKLKDGTEQSAILLPKKNRMKPTLARNT
jgi:hypothetical protein